MAGFRFIRMQIIMFRLNLKFAFVHTVRSGERDKSRSLIHNYSARVYENIDRLPPFSPQSFRLAAVVKRQKSRDKNKILSETFGWIRRFYSRIMLFSCFEWSYTSNIDLRHVSRRDENTACHAVVNLALARSGQKISLQLGASLTALTGVVLKIRRSERPKRRCVCGETCRTHVTGRFRVRIDINVRISSLWSNISP